MQYLLQQVVDIQPSQSKSLIEEAQAIWSRFYGKVRASGTDNRAKRRDLGVPRQKLSHPKPSLATWLEKRKLEISEGQDKRPAVSAASDFPLLPVWTEGHDKEMAFIAEPERLIS